jgi:hypothetical protein
MIAGNEQALRSAWELFAFRGAALSRFHVNPEAFRQSWWALALSLPLGLFGVAVTNVAATTPISLPAVTFFMCLNWLIGVGGVVFFAFLLQQSARLTATIIILNWVSLWANLFFVLPSILVLAGLPRDVLGIFQLVIISYFSAIQGFVLWKLWGISISLVIGVVLCLFLIDRFTNSLFFTLTQPPAKIAKPAIPATDTRA